MSNQFNTQPQYQQPLIANGQTTRDWYFFFSGLFRGLPPGNVEPITPGASPYTYSAARRGSVIIEGGTVSAVEFSRDRTTYYDVGAVAGMFQLSASDVLRVTYTVIPTMTFVPS